jgi:sortase (surface protein transpeptidase)
VPATAPATLPVPVQAGKQPTTLRIAELDMVVPVTAMGWELTLVDGVRTTRWAVPARTAGWMPNTAGVGEPGNMVIAGHQAQGDAVFAALALGEILPGQTIAVTGEDGRSFDYRVVEVSDPVSVLGATAADTARAAAYVAPSEDGRLTLVSGWPGDTTTHRIFAVAELVGPAQ